MVEAYRTGASAEEAAALLGYSETACYAALRKYQIPTRSISEAHRKYAVNESFFDVIDTEEKAYWLGFITADGSVSPLNNALQITLHERDEGHLRKFLTSLQSAHPIYRIRKREVWHSRVFIGSIRLTNALIRLGITPNKTFTIAPCSSVPTNLLPDYWRGVFDGDGSIFALKRAPRRLPAWGLKLVGSKAIAEGFKSFCHEFTDSKANTQLHLRSFIIKYSGVELIQTILSVLYGNAAIYLDRKKELADRIINYRHS